ncbi:hypothetical protein BDY17DRAFT_187367 [Neohortaea acidophila]|uniref:Membrane-associated proteins in eicosanoid and glutathione metabolism n=1 Tax=Neohortaea acidophila TaxID=245834 RepID=A0A6A6PMM8_9PEZI|nr:uncharacterized protein BDY17DRAFT_187367 [Neohortaea acidophila]KAF2481368.1 hypothetical protein BDY17DRAFT_187367 [Neohortaea acidophila]
MSTGALTSALLPKDYGYVIISAAASFGLGMWHAYRIVPFRKRAGVKYPRYYAENSDITNAESAEKKQALYLYNCAQRAHGNWMENHPPFVIALLVAGLRYPIASTALAVGWMVFRTLYAVGYTRSDKTDGKGRLIGTPASFLQLGLYGLMAWTGYTMVR